MSVNRRRSIRKSAWTGILAKMAMVLPVLILPKVLVPLLGPERFGIFLTILSIATFLSISDLGIGSNLITTLSNLVGGNHCEEAARIQTNGFAVVGLISLILFIISLVLFKINLGAQFFPKSNESLQREASQAIAVMVLMFAVTTPLMLVNKIQFAFHRGHLANLWQVGAAVLNFSFAYFAALMDMGIAAIVASLYLGNLICGSINTLQHVTSGYAERPRPSLVDLKSWKPLLSGSSFYLAIQIVYLITFGLDAVMISRGVGAVDSAKYALADRVFGIVAIGTTIVTTPLWALYGDAYGSGQHDLAFRTLKKWTLRIVISAFLAVVAITLIVNHVIVFLSSGALLLPKGLAVSMGIWRIVESIGLSISVYLYSIHRVRLLLSVCIANAVFTFAVKLSLLPLLGISIMPIITASCYSIICLLPCCFIIKSFRSSCLPTVAS